MSVFYTHVYQKGNNIRARLMDAHGNRRFIDKKVKPEYYVQTHDKSEACKEFTGARGEMLKRLEFKSYWEMREFIEENKDNRGIKMFGNDDLVHQFINKGFPGFQIDFSWRHIRCANVDIEVVSGVREADGTIKQGPFPLPYVPSPDLATGLSSAFKDLAEQDRYIAAVKRSHEWLRREFPNTVITPEHDLSAAFPITLIQLSFINNVTGEKQMKVWGLPEPNSRDKYKESGEWEGGYNCEYFEFQTEQELLTHFLSYWFQTSFDIWTGWNISSFDNPYIYERIAKVIGPENATLLSPWKDIRGRVYRDAYGKETKTYNYYGCETVDFLELYKKHRLITREEYNLNFISHVELGEGKLNYEEAKTLTNLYFTNWNKYVDYGKTDIRRVDQLNEKLPYIRLTFVLAYLMKCNYSDTLATVEPWKAKMDSFLHDRGVKPERKRQITDKISFAGGHVNDVIPGFYKWLLSEDLNSLYPHLIQQWNLGVETIIDDPMLRDEIITDLCDEIRDMISAEPRMQRKQSLRRLLEKVLDNSNDIIDELIEVGKIEFKTLKQYNVCMTPNIQFFSLEKMSFLSEIMRTIYAGRKADKKEMQLHEQRALWAKEAVHGEFVLDENVTGHRAYTEEFVKKLTGFEKPALETLKHDEEWQAQEGDSMQHGKKICMNSGYGAITNIYFRDYFDIRIGEGICASGRLVNRYTQHKLNIYLNELLETSGVNYCVYGDTDSIYLALDIVLEKSNLAADATISQKVNYLDNFEKTVIDPKMVEIAEEICSNLNCFEQRMVWEREVIAQSAIWQAPKLYIMAVNNSEGTVYPDDKPKIKMQGVAAKKSDYPEWSRGKLAGAYKICLLGNQSQLTEYIREVKAEYKALPPEEIAAAKGINNIEKWALPNGMWRDGTPWHVRASLAHNIFLSEHPVDGATPIESGDKIKTLKMVPTAPVLYKTFAFKDYLPKEWGLERYINYDEMLNATFMKPLDLIVSKMGWKTDTRHNFLAGKGEIDPTKHRGLSRAQKMQLAKGKGNINKPSTGKKLW